ncbi:MFS transporter [Nocardia sp. BMG51109]|uniref:MFS transporter n=1 Tax=Nocardia sp. BMG51109 TaxID=1056816 RepID=UPI0004633746|nr:MFS transporter [Nocardia sp. BMG51109]
MARVKSRPHYNVVFAVLLLGIAAYALLQSMVVPVLSLLIPALHTTQNTATWLMTGYLLSASVATPILGRIGDKVGKERMLVVTLAALSIGSLIAALTDSISVMIVARVIQGLGGGVIPLAFGIIRDEFPARKVPGAVGIASSLIAVGSGIGLVLAGPIVDHLGHHWLFWAPMIMTAFATVAAIVLVPPSPVRSEGRINWAAALLLSAWLVALLLAVSKGTDWGWTSAVTLGLFAAAVVCLIVWIVVETKSATPLIDMRTMRIRAVWTTNLVAVLAGIGMYAIMTFLPQLLQTPKAVAGYGLSASVTQSGLYMLPMAAAMFVIGLSIGGLEARFGARPIVLGGSIITVAAFMVLALGHDASWQIYLSATVLGIGIGLVFSSMPAIIVASVPPVQTGAATGMNANVRTVGGAIGSAVSGVLLTSSAGTVPGIPAASGYSKVFWFLAGVSVLGVVAAASIPRLRGRSRPPGAVEPVVDILEPDVGERELVSAAVVAPARHAASGASPSAHAPEPASRHADSGPPNGSGESGVVESGPAESGAGRAIAGHILGEHGRPVAGAALTLIDQRGHQVSRSLSGSEGDYGIDAPAPGSYVLIASAGAHRPVAQPVTVHADPQRLNLTMPASGEVSGVVRRADGAGPLGEATVTLTDPDGEVVGTAITTDDGRYACGAVAPGSYTLVAVAERMRPHAATLTVPESGALRFDIDLEAEATAVLAGSAQADGRVVPDAQVTVLDADGGLIASARTDADGRYQVSDLPEGRYTVVTRGYPPVTANVTVTGDEITHDVRLSY